MSALSFGGIWTHPSLTFPEHADFMSIDESRGRIISFIVISTDPLHRAPMRHWYQPESATSITARLRQADPWRAHAFHLDGDTLTWTYAGGTHTWRRVHPSEQPDWLETRLTAENSRMDSTEESA